jgi:signal transduction histidine kinase
MRTAINDDSDEFSAISWHRPGGDTDKPSLLTPLADAVDAVARLEASAAAASPAVAEGLRARIAYREAAGWLAHAHTWLHPRDLALRDVGLTGSYAVAVLAGRLQAELPTMALGGSAPEMVPSDQMVGTALRLARLWRRLAEHRTWHPLADAAAVRDILGSLGWSVTTADTAVDEWLAAMRRPDPGPALIRAGRGARDWINRQGHADPLAMDGLFLAACLWRDSGFGRDIALPFWSAPVQFHHRLALQVGVAWLASFLACITAASRAARDELVGLQRAEMAGASLARTARSQLPRALDHVLRTPIVTARGLAERLAISSQAALGLLRQLTAAGVVREATGRAAWRAFTTT